MVHKCHYNKEKNHIVQCSVATVQYITFSSMRFSGYTCLSISQIKKSVSQECRCQINQFHQLITKSWTSTLQTARPIHEFQYMMSFTVKTFYNPYLVRPDHLHSC